MKGRSTRLLSRGIALAVGGALACGGERSPASAAAGSARDSAGIEIVDNPTPDPLDGDLWTVSPEPSAVLAGTGEPGFALYRVEGLAVLPDGAVAVANAGTQEVAILEADGGVRRRLGGPGQGPGEFQWLNGVLTRADSVVAVDGATLRLSVFAPDGRLAREFGVPAEPGQPTGIRVVGMGREGVAVFREIGFAERLEPGVMRLPGSVFRLAWDGTRAAEFTGEFPGGSIFILDDGMGTLPMGPESALAGSARGLAAGDGARPEVRWYGPDGELRRLVRWNGSVRAVDDAVRAAWRAADSSTPGERIPLPGTLPAHGPIHLDARGHLWVQRWAGGLATDPPIVWQGESIPGDAPPDRRPARWWIFDEDGRRLGTVTTPPGLRVLRIGEDAVWGVHRDALDVETVRRHDLGRGGAPP